MADEIEARKIDVEITIPGIGKKVIARWYRRCEPPINILLPTLQLATDLDIELTLDKLKKIAGALGKIFKSEDLDEMINNAKELVPSGKAGFSITFKPQIFHDFCPGSKRRLAYMGYSLKLAIVLSIAGQYGVIKGKAHVAIEVEIASDFHECECAPAGEDDSQLVYCPEINDSDNLLLADGPIFPGPTSPCEGIFSTRPSPLPSGAIPKSEAAADSDGPGETSAENTTVPNETLSDAAALGDEIVVTARDLDTGETRVLRRFPMG